MAVNRKQPRKKAVVKASATVATSGSSSAREATKPEYLVFYIPESLKEGSNLRLVNVSESFDKARKHVEKMPGGKTSYYAILEKKAVLLREPVTTTSETGRNIVNS